MTRPLAIGPFWWLLLLGLLAGPAVAEDLLMARSTAPFAESMLQLQDAIHQRGYVISRVQRVDIGLTRSGFKTDKYRVVFYARPGELRRLARQVPELIAFLPLKISIFAEGDDTLVVAANPQRLKALFAGKGLDAVFDRWTNDLMAILDRMRATE